MRDGTPVLVRLPELDFYDDREGKPVAIHQQIGRRPIAAFGNSDGDLQMLQWTTAGQGPRFALYVHHTDAEREWAYDRKSTWAASTKASTKHRRKAGRLSTCSRTGSSFIRMRKNSNWEKLDRQANNRLQRKAFRRR